MDPFAVLSDVHGNIEALEAVLGELRRIGIATVYSLGDTVGYGPDPVACVAKVRERCCVWVMGNHELALGEPDTSLGFTPAANFGSKLRQQTSG